MSHLIIPYYRYISGYASANMIMSEERTPSVQLEDGIKLEWIIVQEQNGCMLWFLKPL